MALDAHGRLEDMKVAELRQLFNAIDPSPFREIGAFSRLCSQHTELLRRRARLVLNDEDKVEFEFPVSRKPREGQEGEEEETAPAPAAAE